MFRRQLLNKHLLRCTLVATITFPLVLAGCASSHVVAPPLATAASTDAKYTLNILEEVNDGARLYVTAQVTVLEPLTQTQALVRLRTMANGTSVGESFVPLSDANRSPQSADTYHVKMSADAASFTDYQLDLLWGSEAVAYLQALPRDEVVKVSNLTLQNAAKGKKPKINGKFENRGVLPITQLTALVQLVWVPEGGKLDLSGLKAENDTEVEVPGLSILPGGSKDFSIELEVSIPAVKGGSYQPVVRIKNEPRRAEPSPDSPPADPAGQ